MSTFFSSDRGRGWTRDEAAMCVCGTSAAQETWHVKAGVNEWGGDNFSGHPYNPISPLFPTLPCASRLSAGRDSARQPPGQ